MRIKERWEGRRKEGRNKIKEGGKEERARASLCLPRPISYS